MMASTRSGSDYGLTAHIGGGDWRENARCRDADDLDLWFPTGTTGPALQQTELARIECYRCPVRARCLEWALDQRIDDGIFGGMTPGERRAELRKRAKAVAA